MDKNTILRIDKTEDNKGFDLGIKSYKEVGAALTEWAGQMHRKGDDKPLHMLVSAIATIATKEGITDMVVMNILRMEVTIRDGSKKE